MAKKVKISRKEERAEFSRYHALAYSLFGNRAKKIAEKRPKLDTALIQARMRFIPEEYVARVLMNSVIAGVAGIMLSSLIIYLSTISILPLELGAIAVPLPILCGFGMYFVQLATPSSKAKERKKEMDKKLPYAMNFISAMASADVNPDVIFRELSKEKIYTEVAKEASWITRDVDILGKDIITALREAVDRSPSTMFQDFLQGVITTTSSGGRLKPYFVLKAKQYMEKHRIEQKGFQEFLGMLAESFVTVVVAGPLFLIVMLSLMGLVGQGTISPSIILYAIAFIMVPAAQVGFIWVIKSLSPEVG